MNGTQYISDYLTEDEILKWKSGENILIHAGTNAGKTVFSTTKLPQIAAKHNKRVKLLVPRTTLRDQLLDRLPSNVDIELYQNLEKRIYNNKEKVVKELNDYMFIVADECHYFYHDSGMNLNTSDSLEIIFNSTSVKIFMSATPGLFEQKCLEQGLELTVYNFAAQQVKIDSLTFYADVGKDSEDEALMQIVDICVSNRIKALIFVQKMKTGLKLYKKYKDYSLFLCSKHKPEYKKYVDQAAIKKMQATEKFDKTLLITTSAMDVGFTLKDADLNVIVIDGFIELGTIKQMIGRKRIVNGSDRVQLFIKKLNNRSVSSWRSRLLGRLRMAEDYRRMELSDFIKKHFRKTDSLGIIYDDIDANGHLVKRFNNERYAYYRSVIEEYESIIAIKPYGLKTYLSDALGIIPLPDWDNSANKDLYEYLKSLADRQEVMLTQKDREPFLERLNIRRNGRIVKNKDALNALFKSEYGITNYEIKDFKTNRKVDGKIKQFFHAWKIVKI